MHCTTTDTATTISRRLIAASMALLLAGLLLGAPAEASARCTTECCPVEEELLVPAESCPHCRAAMSAAKDEPGVSLIATRQRQHRSAVALPVGRRGSAYRTTHEDGFARPSVQVPARAVAIHILLSTFRI